jgi:hypothetical protein
MIRRYLWPILSTTSYCAVALYVQNTALEVLIILASLPISVIVWNLRTRQVEDEALKDADSVLTEELNRRQERRRRQPRAFGG